MMDSAVRITSAGDLLGTGFLVTVPSETIEGHRWGYVVTAHHVIDNQCEVAVQAPNPFANGALYDPVPVSDWRQPLDGVDIALAPWRSEGRGTRHPAFPIELMIPTDVVAGIHLGSPIYYIGIFEPLMRPVVRSGTLAAIDQEGIPKRDYPVHLVDCRSYSGFSGSPCLVEFTFAKLEPLPASKRPWGDYPPEMWSGGESVPELGGLASFVLFCGMFVGHFSDEVSAAGAISRYGMGVMIRGHEIQDVLLTDEAREERLRWDKEKIAMWEASQPPLRDAGARPAPADDEWSRVEALASRLVRMPKQNKAQEEDNGNLPNEG